MTHKARLNAQALLQLASIKIVRHATGLCRDAEKFAMQHDYSTVVVEFFCSDEELWHRRLEARAKAESSSIHKPRTAEDMERLIQKWIFPPQWHRKLTAKMCMVTKKHFMASTSFEPRNTVSRGLFPLIFDRVAHLSLILSLASWHHSLESVFGGCRSCLNFSVCWEVYQGQTTESKSCVLSSSLWTDQVFFGQG